MPVDALVEGVRARKDAGEIARIAEAQELTDAAFDHILGFVAVGMTENQVALELEFYMRTHGSDGIAFAPIVASGPNSALPHAHPGERVLTRGDFLKMDFGARVGGYCADMTRTVVLGTASERQREIYSAVLAANLAGIAAVMPGSGRSRYRRCGPPGDRRTPASARTSVTGWGTASGLRSTSSPDSAHAAPASFRSAVSSP